MKRKKTVKNPRGAGRKPMFKKEFGKIKRISVSIPSKKEVEIKKYIADILKPYLD